MARITAEDRAAAQHLPEAFRQLPGDTRGRVVELVQRHWGAFDDKRRAQLVEALLPIFQKLVEPDAEITDEICDLCEGVVGAWIFRQPHRPGDTEAGESR